MNFIFDQIGCQGFLLKTSSNAKLRKLHVLCLSFLRKRESSKTNGFPLKTYGNDESELMRVSTSREDGTINSCIISVGAPFQSSNQLFFGLQ